MEGVWGKLAVATLLVGRSVDDARNLCPTDGTGTHGAWFHRDVERAVGEVFPAKGIGGSRYRLHLGMGGNVVESFGEVVGAGYYPVAAYYYCADGYLAFVIGGLGLDEGLAHELPAL